MRKFSVIIGSSLADITMKLILACMAVVLLSSAVELARPMRRQRKSIAQIYGDITPVPEQILEVSFGDLVVTPGMEVRPGDAMEMPCIDFDYDPGCYYTFMEISHTWPYPKDPFLSPSVLAMYVNMYGDSDMGISMSDSCEIASYVPPCPPPGSGSHQYLMYVYKQKGVIDTTNEELLSYQINRSVFSLDDFAKTYKLSGPVAGCFFNSTYPV
ncbi:protein D2-like [Maniola hyperantus]|uniref:protein D2-like n=1 Tax=Aphantopus hyperantus TaxID=2795564 RepID=UPI00213399E5